jgi:acetylglutamate kinase
MKAAIRKAETLIEALNFIRTFRDKVTVIKLGGSTMDDPDVLRTTLQDVVFLSTVGLRAVVVHGGGRPIDRAMEAAGIRPRKILGRRYTDDATLEIVVRVLRHEINAGIVRLVRELGGRAVGLHSDSLQCLFGDRLLLTHSELVREEPSPAVGEETPVDLGRVGKVTRVDAGLIQDFCAGGVVPVIPCIARDPDGGWLNVNGDTAAADVAAALKAEKLVFLSDTPGVLRDRKDPGSLISSLNDRSVRELFEQRIIDGGMIPKVEACLDALRGGVKKAHMIDGRVPHSLLLEIFTDRGIGTEIVLGQP